VRHENGVALFEQLLRFRDERGPLFGRDGMRRFRGRDSEAAIDALEANLDGVRGGHG
jgi:hypothetical protein